MKEGLQTDFFWGDPPKCGTGKSAYRLSSLQGIRTSVSIVLVSVLTESQFIDDIFLPGLEVDSSEERDLLVRLTDRLVFFCFVSLIDRPFFSSRWRQ